MHVWKLIQKSVPLNTTFGDAAISEKHCNFLINKGNASFKDMLKLIKFIEKNVQSKTGVKLEKEIEIIKKVKKKILILGGGVSREREISLKTANQVKNCLKKI